MPTTIARHIAFDPASGRWTDFFDVEAVESERAHAILFVVLVIAALALGAACLASDLHPAALNATSFSSLLGP